jgi:hypothetical protein
MKILLNSELNKKYCSQLEYMGHMCLERMKLNDGNIAVIENNNFYIIFKYNKTYKLDYTLNTSINVSMVDFKNAGLTDDEILKVVRAQEYVNCAIMTRSFCGCEITFYGSCFNRTVIEQTVKEIQDNLNYLVQNKQNKQN